jgi:hypothetical protein
MANEISKPPPRALDNFAAFDESVEGDDEHFVGSRLKGTRLRFTNNAAWVTVTGEVLTGHVLVAINVRRTEIKWGTIEKKPPLEVRELQEGDKFRALDALNASCPQSEWRMSYGKFVGPWERQYIVELVDLATMKKYSWPTSTIGGSIATRELVDAIMTKRQFERREQIWPVVKLSATFMKTGWEGRQRPDLKIIGWYPPKAANANAIATDPTSPALPAPEAEATVAMPWDELTEAEQQTQAAQEQAREQKRKEAEAKEQAEKPSLQADMKDQVTY